jgi:hypothetical protein
VPTLDSRSEVLERLTHDGAKGVQLIFFPSFPPVQMLPLRLVLLHPIPPYLMMFQRPFLHEGGRGPGIFRRSVVVVMERKGDVEAILGTTCLVACRR